MILPLSSTGPSRVRINAILITKISIFLKGRTFPLQHLYNHVHPMWFQDPILKMSGVNPVHQSYLKRIWLSHSVYKVLSQGNWQIWKKMYRYQYMNNHQRQTDGQMRWHSLWPLWPYKLLAQKRKKKKNTECTTMISAAKSIDNYVQDWIGKCN